MSNYKDIKILINWLLLSYSLLSRITLVFWRMLLAAVAGIVVAVDCILDEVKPSGNNPEWLTLRFIATENYKGTDILPDFPNVIIPLERSVWNQIKSRFVKGKANTHKFCVSVSPAKDKYPSRLQFDLHMPSLRSHSSVVEDLDRILDEEFVSSSS